MKLCAISPFTNASEAEILAFLSNTTASLVLLPGRSQNTPSPEKVQGTIRHGVSVFVEYKSKKNKSTPYLVTNRKLMAMPRQIFCQRPAVRQIDNLVACLPSRTFAIGSRMVTFFICGELIAFNPDGSVKHGRQLPYDILANPSHTIMGHWNHLGKKLSSLSLRTVTIYTTNNDRNHSGITTDVRIYKNGKVLTNRTVHGKIVCCECRI
jgi:hypothetical protein